ncbi:MAG: DUF2442 domain-containing protein [Armatimonadetes bacterium]|nr:DUF2442 domain-containing protein [Armatimonadota bacterium]
MLSVTKAEYLNNFSIRLTFNNGKTGVFDFKNIIFKDHRPIFEPLKDKNYFRKFYLKYDTLVWENELDLAPEYLFFQVFKNNPEYQEMYKKWEYI